MHTKEEALKALRPIEPKQMTEVQKQAILRLQLALEDYVHFVYENVPDSAARDRAMLMLLDHKQTCVHAITHVGFGSAGAQNEKGKEDKKAANGRGSEHSALPVRGEGQSHTRQAQV